MIKYISKHAAPLLKTAAAVCAGMLFWACGQDDTDPANPYIYFKPDRNELSFTVAGGSQQYEMYTNMGPWVVETEFTEDTEWIDIWPREGNRSGRFTITASANEGVYTRYATVNVVSNGKAIASFTVSQGSSTPVLELDMGVNTLTSPSSGSKITVPIKANLGWKAEVVGDARGWIEIGEADDANQTLTTTGNSGAERIGEVKFSGIGTNYENITTSVFIKQFDTTKDPFNGTLKTVAETLSALGEDGGGIDRNEWLWVTVTSDRSKLNLPADVMFVQDESERGIMIQFVSARDNVYDLGDKLKVHLYEANFMRDEVSKGLKLYPFLSTSVFESAKGAGNAEPVTVTDLSRIDDYENTLVTLPAVEFVIPVGTYVNIDETKYDVADQHPTSTEFHDGSREFGHILRDKAGNMVHMYSMYTFLDRFKDVMPEGSGAVTGIVTKRTRNNITSSVLRIRNHDDNKVSKDASARLSKTHTQFGPFVGRTILPQINAQIGSGQLKTTQWENVSTSAGTSIDYGWSYARRTPAEITVQPDGTQVANPQLSSADNQKPADRMFSCLSCQYFWNYTGSTMNRQGMGVSDLGEAWVFIFRDIPQVKGDLYLDFTYSSSQTGPMYHSIEWSELDTNPISLWNKVDTGIAVSPDFSEGNFIAPEWNYSTHLKEFSVKLPDELKGKQNFTVRMRVVYNWRARNDGTGISDGGAPRTSFVALREANQ